MEGTLMGKKALKSGQPSLERGSEKENQYDQKKKCKDFRCSKKVSGVLFVGVKRKGLKTDDLGVQGLISWVAAALDFPSR